MTGTADAFTDRERELKAVARLVASGSRRKVLAVYGVSGAGKTAFLRHVQGQAARGFPRVLVDVQDMVSGFSFLPEAGEDLALELLRRLGVALADCAPWWRRRRLRRRAARIGGSSPRGGRVSQWQVALWKSTISDSPQTTTFDDSSPESARRSSWVDDLAAVAAAVRRRRCLLLVDTTEWLYYFDDVRREQRRPGKALGVGVWFTNHVLIQLLDAVPQLKVVLAGQDRLALDRLPAAARITCELTDWDEGHTAAYLARLGLPDQDLAEVVQRLCGGMPLLAWLLARACLDRLEDGAPVTAAWLADQARDRSLREWFPEHVLERLTGEQRELIQACAVLRTITEGAIEALVAGTDLTPGWASGLQRHYLMEKVPVPGRAMRWRMHAIVRSWLLAYLDRQDADRPPGQRILPRYHQRAATYYTQLERGAFTAEAAYHSFASADPGPAQQWRSLMTAALYEGNFDQALLLAEAAATPGLEETLPAVHAAAAHARAYVAYCQERFAEGAEYARNATMSYSAAADPPGHARLLQLAGQLAWRLWDRQLARRSWQEALEVPGGITLPDDRLKTAVALAEATLSCGDGATAAELIAQARQLMTSAGNVSGGAPESTTEAEICVPGVDLASAALASRYDLHLLSLSAEAALLQGEWGQADVLLAAADSASRASGDHHLLADVLCLRGVLSTDQWDLPGASGFLKAAMDAARDCPDESSRVRVLTATGILHCRKAVSGPPAPVATSAAVGTATSDGGRAVASISLNRMAEARHEWQLATELMSAALDVAEQIGDRAGEADAHWGLGNIAWCQDEYDVADKHHTPALALYQQIGNRDGEARACWGLGETALLRGDLGTADQHYSPALALYQQIGNRDGEAYARLGLGDTARVRGDLGTADQHYAQALALHEQIGNREGEGRAHFGLGDAALLSGDPGAANQHFTQALGLYEQIGNRVGEADAHRGLGGIALLRGDLGAAHQHHAQALALHRQTGDRYGEARAYLGLGDTARMRRDWAAADQHFTQALTLYQQIGDRLGEAYAHLGLGDTERIRGDLAASDQHQDQALVLSRQAGDRGGEARARWGLGETARARGDVVTAEQHFTRAQALYQQADDRNGEALAFWGLGETARMRGNLAAADQHFTRALTLYQQTGNRLEEAETRQSLAEVDRLYRKTESYESHLRQAADLYEESGLTLEADNIRRQLLGPPEDQIS